MNIPYLVIKGVVVQVPERITEERPPSPRVVDERFLGSPDNGAGPEEIIGNAASGRIEGQVAGVVPDEVSTDAVE